MPSGGKGTARGETARGTDPASASTAARLRSHSSYPIYYLETGIPPLSRSVTEDRCHGQQKMSPALPAVLLPQSVKLQDSDFNVP